MPIKGRGKGYPFPGARSHVWLPMPANAFDPKSWGIGINWQTWNGTFAAPGAMFITKGVIVGDPFFVMDTNLHITFATTVGALGNEDYLILADVFGGGTHQDCLYKVGEKAVHTLRTMAKIISERAINAYTIHFFQLWCDAQIQAFNRDETGEVYCIDPEEEPRGGHFRINEKDYEAAAVADWTEEDWAAELGKEIIP